MKVVIDLDLGSGHAQCEQAAPEVFRVNGDAEVVVLQEFPDESLRVKVEQAAIRCPGHFIAIAT